MQVTDNIKPAENRMRMNREGRRAKIAFFGHFGGSNLGNDSTLEAILYHLHRVVPDAEFSCVCTGPESVAKAYGIRAVPCRSALVKPRTIHNRASRWAYRLAVSVPVEIYRWLKGIKTLWGSDALIIPGTGLLTDAHSLLDWGPYDMFRWSVTAKVCGCKLLFVSVGAGPIYSRLGRFFIKAALTIADFRSYRDQSTEKCLEEIGFQNVNDKVYPDLAFSLPQAAIPTSNKSSERKLVVGLGVMAFAGRYSVEKLDDFNDRMATDTIYATYLDTLVGFMNWLLARGYNVRLLIGDIVDKDALQKFRSLLMERFPTCDSERVIDESVESVEDLLSQIAATDFVVATRFHNVLLSLLLNKPVLSISFHHKCSSLMSEMGISEYCQDIEQLNTDKLVGQFRLLEKNAASLKHMLREKVSNRRRALDDQFSLIFAEVLPGYSGDLTRVTDLRERHVGECD
jgi:polysaccharide pyruvyl transferase WcaK-like protein